MTVTFKDSEKLVLERVISERRSIRKFKAVMPPRAAVENMIEAGLRAPFAGAAGMPLKETRKFIVFKRGTAEMLKAEGLIMAAIRKNAKKFAFMSNIIPNLRKNGAGFRKRLESLAKDGSPGLKTAACYIVVAERKAIPASQSQSIAHVMQNMWLEATASNLGFQLLSATAMMEKDRAFVKLLGLPFGEYKIDGCLAGYPDYEPAPREKVTADEITSWRE